MFFPVWENSGSPQYRGLAGRSVFTASAGYHGQGRPSFPAWLVAPWCSVSRNPSSERRGSTRCASRVIIHEVVAWRGRCRGGLAIFVFMFHLAFPTEGLAATPRASNQTSVPVYRAVALNATIVSRVPSAERPLASGAEPGVLPITSGEHPLGSAVMSPHRRPVLIGNGWGLSNEGDGLGRAGGALRARCVLG